MTPKHHYFLAIPIDKPQQSILKSWIEANKGNLSFKSWVHEADYHITLAFLGHVEIEEQLNHLSRSMKEIVDHFSPFHLKLKGLGVFGKNESPRVFWAGIEDSPLLQNLQKEVFKICKEVGFKLDSKPFRPHITLARRWQSDEVYKVDAQSLFENEQGSFLVDKVHLYKTHLDRRPKYEVVNSYLLRGDKQ